MAVYFVYLSYVDGVILCYINSIYIIVTTINIVVGCLNRWSLFWMDRFLYRPSPPIQTYSPWASTWYWYYFLHLGLWYFCIYVESYQKVIRPRLEACLTNKNGKYMTMTSLKFSQYPGSVSTLSRGNVSVRHETSRDYFPQYLGYPDSDNIG